jgi:hypothetical protein
MAVPLRNGELAAEAKCLIEKRKFVQKRKDGI